MSEQPGATPFAFQATPHSPRQQCNAKLTLHIPNTEVTVDIPCDLTAHRVTTRHCCIGAASEGAPVEIYWRDVAVKPKDGWTGK